MSSSRHPVLQLADDSIKTINKQLNYNSLHHNSVCIKNSAKVRKKRGLKIGGKMSYVISPSHNTMVKPMSSLTLSDNTLKHHMHELQRELDLKLDEGDMVTHTLEDRTDRNSDATTLKEGSLERVTTIKSDAKVKHQKRKGSKSKNSKF
jgi:hypothetical protein